jgi:glycosyltransferase involved in cell wall biosynthesis
MPHQVTPRILHISFDFPDGTNDHVTEAVQRLVDGANWAENVVLSFHRSSRFAPTAISKFDADRYRVFFHGLPCGIGLARSLRNAAAEVSKFLSDNNIQFDIVHAHKATIEGYLGWHVAQRFSKPLMCTIRGNTDIKVLRAKPLYRRSIRRVADSCTAIFSISPWATASFDRLCGTNISEKSVLLPNTVELEPVNLPRAKTKSDLFVTTFNFARNNHRIKRLDLIIKAFDRLAAQGYPYALDIVGDGNQRPEVEKLVAGARFPGRFRLLGHYATKDLPALYRSYAGFVLPSYPETFGLVYIEAIASGLPVIHARNAGIDGYFSADVAIPVSHRSVSELANAIRMIGQNQDSYHFAVQRLIQSGYLGMFAKSRVHETYRTCVLSAFK